MLALRGWLEMGLGDRGVCDSIVVANRRGDHPMTWTTITRAQHARDHLRYASDLSEAEWALIAPSLPPPSGCGRPRSTDLRAVVEAVLYLLATGCQWRALPREFPPRSTVQRYFYGWRDTGLWARLNRQLVGLARQRLGRAPQPSLGIIDAQSVPTTESGGPRGLDAAKRIKGRKRHIVTDTQGFLLESQVQPADLQDNHGAVPLLRALHGSRPTLHHLLADRVYRGRKLLGALADLGPWTIEIVQRPAGRKGFQLLPRRWVVERSFAWFGRNRRLAKDFEASIESAQAWLILASIKLLTRRIARAQPPL
jgi:putative transposase